MQYAEIHYEVPTKTTDGPEQMFWTEDVVEITSDRILTTWDNKPVTTQETLIEYGYAVDAETHPWRYSVRLDDDPSYLGRGHVDEEDLKLVRRGNLWNYYHDQPLVFKDVAAEGQFFFNLGHVTMVRNRGESIYFSLPKLMKAMKRGKVDTFTRSKHYTTAYKFDDPEVGRRVRMLTLEEFKDWKERVPRDEW